MDIFEKQNKSKIEENNIPITKEPTLDIIAIWYGLTPRGFRKRRKAYGVCIKERVLTEGVYGEIFYKCSIPPKLPQELHEWAKDLSTAWCRRVPLNSF